MTEQVLTIVAPEGLGQSVEDLLLANPAVVAGFTAVRGEGHGNGAHLRSMAECVDGHAPMRVIYVVGQPEDIARMVALMQGEFSGSGMYYWVMPVMEAGRL